MILVLYRVYELPKILGKHVLSRLFLFFSKEILFLFSGLAAPAIAAGFSALAPTLGTIIPVIGAGGFAAAASAAGTVAGSVAVAASFGGKIIHKKLEMELITSYGVEVGVYICLKNHFIQVLTFCLRFLNSVLMTMAVMPIIIPGSCCFCTLVL